MQSDSINCALWSALCLKIAARYLTKDVDEDFGSWMRRKLAAQGVCDLRSCPQAKDQNERFIQRIRTGAHKQLKQLALAGDAGNHLVSWFYDREGRGAVLSSAPFSCIGPVERPQM